MHRSLRSNSTAPAIFPIRNQETARMAGVAAGGAAALVPPAPARIEVWTENPLTGNFNPGTTSGQKIFLEKTKGLDADTSGGHWMTLIFPEICHDKSIDIWI